MIKMNQIISKFRSHKRLIIILSITFLICVAGFLWSQKIWCDYDTNYYKHFDDAKTDINNSFSQIATGPTDSISKKLDIIIEMQTKLEDNIDAYCDVSPIVKWQSFIDQYNKKINNCESQKDIMNQFSSELNTVTEYLKIEQQLANIILVANEKTNQNNQADKWELIEPFWRQAGIEILNLSNTEQFNATKTVAIEKITSIADSWQQLSSANKAQDMQKFQDSTMNLTKTYNSIVEISNTSKLQTGKLFSDLSVSYKKLY